MGIIGLVAGPRGAAADGLLRDSRGARSPIILNASFFCPWADQFENGVFGFDQFWAMTFPGLPAGARTRG